MESIVTKRRFIVALAAIGAWAVVETLTQLLGNPGISMYGQLALSTIVVTYYGGDAASKVFSKKDKQ